MIDKNLDHMLNKKNIQQFWVGLLDGDGSIQVNHWRKKYLQFRIVIKLKLTTPNLIMLKKIKGNIGGYIQTSNQEFVLWIVNDKKEIIKILKILDKYPLLTSRKICQLEFLKKFISMENSSYSIEQYFQTRDKKYEKQQEIIKGNSLGPWLKTSYFKFWLSGFAEAEGCFSVRQNGNKSFSISQKYDLHIIEEIKHYFKAKNKIRRVKGVYIIEIYKKEVLEEISEHFNIYPLMGEKLKSYKIWSRY